MAEDVEGVKKVVPRPLRITQKMFAFALDLENDVHYVFLLTRKKRGGTKVEIFRVVENDVQQLPVIFDIDSNTTTDNIRYALQTTNDEFINTHVDEIVELLWTAIQKWNIECRRALVLKLLQGDSVNPLTTLSHQRGAETLHASGTALKELTPFVSIDGVSHGIGQVGHPFAKVGQQPILSLSKPINNFCDLIEYVAKNISEELAESLEVVATVALSIKLPQISKDKRPLWLLIVGEPSTLKSTVLKFLEYSDNTMFIEDVTAAGILPARDEVPSLLPQMNNKIVVFPTLSLIASQDPIQARRLFAFFESIYDGYLRRKTGVSGLKGYPVDTAIIAAITNEVYEDFSEIMIKYGSRWLVYPQTLPSNRFVDIMQRIESIDMKGVRMVASWLIDKMLHELSPDALKNYAMTKQYEEDLRVLAELMGKLRVAYHIRKTFDEESNRIVEEVEITQTDYPIRAYSQLRHFVVLNSVLRGWRRIVGIIEVDEHAMRLAAKLATSSTTLAFMKIINGILKVIDEVVEYGGMLPSIRDLTKLCGVARTSLWRRMMVLEALGIVTSHEEEGKKVWFLEERYLGVLSRYFGTKQRKGEKK